MGPPDIVKKALSAFAREIVSALVELRGSKALFFAYGLSGCRYIEYSVPLLYLKAHLHKLRMPVILDVGSGHSIFPLLLSRIGALCIALDVDEECMRWQRERSGVEGVIASATHLPFRNGSLNAITAISTIEHIPEGDESVMMEIGRALKTGGITVISVPFSSRPFIITDPFYGIPGLLRKSKRLLKAVLKRLGIDIEGRFYMRFYDQKEIQDRFIKASGAKLVKTIFFGGKMASLLYRIVPMGGLTWVEFLISRLLETTWKPTSGSDGVIIVLLKWETPPSG